MVSFEENDMVFNVKFQEYSGVSDHRKLNHRDAEDQHPISAITGLEEELNKKYEKPEGGIGIEDVEEFVLQWFENFDRK